MQQRPLDDLFIPPRRTPRFGEAAVGRCGTNLAGTQQNPLIQEWKGTSIMAGSWLRGLVVSAAALAVTPVPGEAGAPSSGAPSSGAQAGVPERWFAAAYVGEISFTTFGDIVLRFDTDFRDSYIGVLAAGRVFPHPVQGLQFETEVQLGHHWGRQDHIELNAAGIVRWSRFPWSRWLRTSIALGLGPAIASRTPALERKRHDRTSRRMLFMPFEVTAAPPNGSWETFLRAHHRSGGFDFVTRASGSEFVTAGVRLRF